MNYALRTPPPEIAPHVPGTIPSQESVSFDRFGPRWLNHLRPLFGLPTQRRLARAALQIDAIRHWEKEFDRLSDAELKHRSLQMRGRARGRLSLDRLLPEVFGAVSVAAKRTIQLRPFDVQLAAGVVIHHGALAEVGTGEGKTLVAAMPACLNALLGKGVHVTTVNDYLARRDAEWIGPIYDALGLTVGVLQMKMPDEERVRAYRCDVTYGVASEFGFDFLRDRLKIAGDKGQTAPFWAAWTANGQFTRPLDPKVQREHHFALVDEADNIFIDEARTPLIISGMTRQATPEEQVVYVWANKLGKDMTRDKHFRLDEKKQQVELMEEGKQLARWSNPPVGPHSHAMDKLHEHIERADQAKFEAVVDDIVRLHEQGRPVLVGTRSVEKSEALSRMLHEAGIEHEVLNAKQHEREAALVEGAGERGRVMIATNMAGRGTDIRLGPGVAEQGGLHVLGTERHEARRIDRQLAGRAARQGDPGSCQFFLSLDDELLEGLGPARQARLQAWGRAGGKKDWQSYQYLFLKAQRRVERRHRKQRIDLMISEKQRLERLKDIGADPYVDYL